MVHGGGKIDIAGAWTGAGRGTVCPEERGCWEIGLGVGTNGFIVSGFPESTGAGTYFVTTFGTYIVFVTGLYLTTVLYPVLTAGVIADWYW